MASVYYADGDDPNLHFADAHGGCSPGFGGLGVYSYTLVGQGQIVFYDRLFS